ncbi:MAG TPA: glycosyltransferase family 39 protein [Acidisarcina sp.]|nr:glycosyltransferase family 39 protein [Acidisarcina sp.]
MHAATSRKVTFLLLALLAGAALRLWFIHAFPEIDGDPLVYGDMAKNLLQHGIYGRTMAEGIQPTLIRLPGYPLFLAACFRVFGMEHYHAVLYVQAAVDLLSCLLIAAFVRRISGERQAWIALYLAALCPFTANYTASAMPETLSIFCVALALYALALLRPVLLQPATTLQPYAPDSRQRTALAIGLPAFAFSFAALLRPDGALLAIAFWPAILLHGARRGWTTVEFRRSLRDALLCGSLAVLPFVPWTLRNWHTFHLFQPLAPRYATDPGEPVNPGFQRWMKTWCIDFSSTYEIYWNVENDRMDIHALPSRAFDSSQQFATTQSLFDEYNRRLSLTPELDARFQALADERVRTHPLRYYVVLPLGRVSNMWLRPRVEMLPIELRWWQYWLHHNESYFAFAYGALNLGYLIAALAGLLRRPPFATAMVAYMLLRSLLLATIEAPETRYTLECYPMILALAAIAFSRYARGTSTSAPSACLTQA